MGDISVFGTRQTDFFIVTTNGQTGFTLADDPVIDEDVKLHINGVQQKYVVDFTVSGTTLTWLDTDFTLAIGDEVTVDYSF